MEKNIQSVSSKNDYAFQLRILARRLLISLIIFFLLSVALALIFIIDSREYYEFEILLPSVPVLFISLIFVLYFFFQLLSKFKFLGIDEPSAKNYCKYSILMVIGFIICINSSFFSFVEVNSDWYYFQHCLAIIGIVLLLVGAINFTRTLSIFKNKKKIRSSSTNRLRFVVPFVFIFIIEVINAIARKIIYLNLSDYVGYGWRSAQAEACVTLNYTTLIIIAFSVMLFFYALFETSKELGTLDPSVSKQYTEQLLETPSERLERICKQLSVFLIITTITVALVVLSVLIEFYWGFYSYSDYGLITSIIEFSLLTSVGMTLVYINTFRFLLQIKEFSNYFPELKKITLWIIFLVGGGIIVITLGCYLYFWSLLTILDLHPIVSKIVIFVGLLLVTGGMFCLRKFLNFFVSKGYLADSQLTGSKILFYSSLFIPFVLLAEIITTSIVDVRFTEFRCTAWDYCRDVITSEGEVILKWLSFSILVLFTLLVILFAIGLSLTGKNLPQIHSILDEKSISEINTISLRNRIIIGLLKGKDRVAYNKGASYDFVLKQRKILSSSRNFIILLSIGILLNIITKIISLLIATDLPFYFYSIFSTFITYGKSFVIVAAYIFLFIFLEELRQVTKNSKAEGFSLGTLIIFSTGMILSVIFRELSFLYIMLFDEIIFFYIIDIVITFIFVLGCVFLIISINEAVSKEKNLMNKLVYFGLVFSGFLMLLRSIILIVVIPFEDYGYILMNFLDYDSSYIVFFIVELVAFVIFGVLMIICTFRIRTQLPDLDPFQLEDVKEGKIDHITSESVPQQVVYAPSDPKPEIAFCVKCGQRINADSKFCRWCGTNIERE